MNARRISILVSICLACWACSGVQPSSKADWTANPDHVESEQLLFTARLTPQKSEAPFYTSFLLMVANKSEMELTVDWNASKYLFNGRAQGALVFQGIDPEGVKTGSVPPDKVAAGQVFTRRVMPLRLIAWNPLKENSSKTPNIRPGMIPAGRNGIRLVIRHAGGHTVIPMSVQISRDDSP